MDLAYFSLIEIPWTPDWYFDEIHKSSASYIPGVGPLTLPPARSISPFRFSEVSKRYMYLSRITCMFGRSLSSQAAGTPIKYEYDSADITTKVEMMSLK